MSYPPGPGPRRPYETQPGPPADPHQSPPGNQPGHPPQQGPPDEYWQQPATQPEQPRAGQPAQWPPTGPPQPPGNPQPPGYAQQPGAQQPAQSLLGQRQMPPGQRPSVPTGQLILQLRRPFIPGFLVHAEARIDGYPVSVDWGTNVMPVPAGTHQVHIQTHHIFSFGPAADAVPVPPGQQVAVHYTPPLIKQMHGRISPTPTPCPGKTAMIVFLSVLGASMLIVFLMALFT